MSAAQTHLLGSCLLFSRRVRPLLLFLLLARRTALRHCTTDEAKFSTTGTSHVVAALRALQHVLALGTLHPIFTSRNHAQQTKVVHRRTPFSFLLLIVIIMCGGATLWAELYVASPA